jgi:FkbM family methyltransferase
MGTLDQTAADSIHGLMSGLIGRLATFFLGNGASWSQFGEDAHVRSHLRARNWTPDRGFAPLRPGFYVDVGCFHPIHLSNTRWFHRQGWRGINIDPSPGVKQLFDRWRPRDTNLQLAISDRAGSLTFYTDGGRANVFNTADEAYAREMVTKGMIRDLVPVRVPCATLASVLEEHAPKSDPIDLMTVDAEGHDLEVLRSNDWQRFRPKVLVVESHVDGLDRLASSGPIAFMLQQGYEIHSWLRPSVMLTPVGEADRHRVDTRRPSGPEGPK